MKPSVAIVNSSSFGTAFPEHLSDIETFAKVQRLALNRTMSSRQMTDLLKTFSALVLSVTPPLSKEILEGLPHLKLIARHGIGIDSIDLAAAKDRNILVTRIPGLIEQTAVAEFTVGLLLSLLRKIAPATLAARQGSWNTRAAFVGTELRDKTVGIFGLGNTGGRIATIIRNGFGARVLGCDPYLSSAQVQMLEAPLTTRAEVFKLSDIIILCSALTSETRGLIGAQALQEIKAGAVLINAARGELIDEPALIAALSSGKIGGYAADVLSEEPPSPSHPFFSFPQVLITPHLGAYTKESLRAMGDTVVGQLRAVLVDNTEPVGLVRE